MQRTLPFLLMLYAFAVQGGQRDTIREVGPQDGFVFREGIYMSFEQLRHNQPVPKSRIATTLPYGDYEFYGKLLSKPFFNVYDDLGSRRKVSAQDVWAYVSNKQLYINHNQKFNLVAYVGSLSHFLSEKRIYREYTGQFYYDYTMTRNMPVSVTTETTEYILSLETGDIKEYNVRTVAASLMGDPELHDEYMQLSRKEREQMKFFYMRKYNKRNPYEVVVKTN